MSAAELILVVEDNPVNRKLVTRFLESRGYAIAHAENTRDAERWLETNVPVVVLMDVSLPGEDGLTLVRRLRETMQYRVPIIALTAHAMAGDSDRAIDAGCDAYLSKPVDLKTLLETVRHLAAHREVA